MNCTFTPQEQFIMMNTAFENNHGKDRPIPKDNDTEKD